MGLQTKYLIFMYKEVFAVNNNNYSYAIKHTQPIKLD